MTRRCRNLVSNVARERAEADVTPELTLQVVLLVTDNAAVVESLDHHPGVTLVVDLEGVGVEVRLLVRADTQAVAARGYPLAELAKLPQKCKDRYQVNGHRDPDKYNMRSFHKMEICFWLPLVMIDNRCRHWFPSPVS